KYEKFPRVHTGPILGNGTVLTPASSPGTAQPWPIRAFADDRPRARRTATGRSGGRDDPGVRRTAEPARRWDPGAAGGDRRAGVPGRVPPRRVRAPARGRVGLAPRRRRAVPPAVPGLGEHRHGP